jgi:hypothetical protein
MACNTVGYPSHLLYNQQLSSITYLLTFPLRLKESVSYQAMGSRAIPPRTHNHLYSHHLGYNRHIFKCLTVKVRSMYTFHYSVIFIAPLLSLPDHIRFLSTLLLFSYVHVLHCCNICLGILLAYCDLVRWYLG